MKKDILLEELIKNQVKNIDNTKKLKFSDLKRITNKLSASIFTDECTAWEGYVTNINNISKGVYINFFYNNKKVALHRLLYNNYIGELKDNEYIKFTCDNKGKCCTIKHLIKYKYNMNPDLNLGLDKGQDKGQGLDLDLNKDNLSHIPIKQHIDNNKLTENSFEISFD